MNPQKPTANSQSPKAKDHPPLNLLTFDIEEWFMSYESSQIPVSLWKSLPERIPGNLTDILAFLEANHLKATFFIMGWVAEQYPDTIRQIAAAGHEIGYHSYYHKLPENQSPKAFESDLVRGLELLQNLTEQPITHYRAPRFSLGFHTGWVIPILQRHGITSSSSVMGGRRQGCQQIPQIPFIFDHQGHQMIEFPLNRQFIFGFHWVYTGSGYLRLLPASLLQQLYTRNKYNMAYFHPRDFDSHVPKTKLLPFYRNMMSNLGNTTTIPKLNQLIKHHTFQTIGQALKTLNPNNLLHLKTNN